jgi:predicted DNA-binding protein (UPF0251 family)
MKNYNIPMRTRGGPNKPKILDILEQDGVDIDAVLECTNNQEEAAEMLGVSQGTLYRWLKGRKR